MADKQIVIDYKNICENYSKEIGCCNTFDGNCSKEECFIYRLLQLLQTKEQECEELKRLIAKQSNAKIQLSKLKDKQYKEFCDMKQTLIEIKKIAGQQCNICEALTPIDEYKDCKKCWQGKILQKISEVENEN